MLVAYQLPPKKRSIAVRGAVGAIAVVLSYLFTIVLAAACLALPFLAIGFVRAAPASAVLLGIFGLIAGLSILYSPIPRRMKFEPHGVSIDIAREARLAAEISAIANALGESVPSEVYLIPEANASVAQLGGLFRRKREILAIGIPLLQLLSVAELRALLSHEFAHFYSGDTRIGPWVYRARLTMVRVSKNLSTDSPAMALITRFYIVAIPYMLLQGGIRLYWNLFMRLTQLISRHQEFRSDEIACSMAGSDALAGTLRKIVSAQAVNKSYWQTIVFPIVGNGFQPQIAEGFGRYLVAPQIAEAAADALKESISNDRTNPFDTHPPLGLRLERANALTIQSPHLDPRDRESLACSLIEDLSTWERALIQKLVPSCANTPLKPMTWETYGQDAFVPFWRKEVLPFLSFLSMKSIEFLPDLVKDLQALAQKVQNPPGMLLSNRQRDEAALRILGSWLALSLLDHGWSVHAQPGSYYMQRQDKILRVSDIPARLKAGIFSPADWAVLCSTAGFTRATSSTSDAN